LGLSLAEIADRLCEHSAVHLSQIERIELAERLTQRRCIPSFAIALAVFAVLERALV
jgi:hypothetical protein